MITFEPRGGLGNQLFSYALGLANSRRLGTELVANLAFLAHDQGRLFEIPSFSNSLASRSPRPRPDHGAAFHLHRVTRKSSQQGKFGSFYYETDPFFDPTLLEVPDGSYLRGYFQSWQYSVTVLDLLKTEILSIARPSPWFLRTTDQLASLGEWVGVHFRLGDYLSIPGLPVDDYYYEKALTLLAELGHRGPLVIFSDEPSTVAKLGIWRRFRPSLIIEAPPESKPVESMVLMSQASHLIIANSTFSWWSARLGETDHGRIVFPRPWSGSPGNDRDLIPPSWIGLGRDTFGRDASLR